MAAQSKSSFMLVLCSRQIPAKANKLILSYLILCSMNTFQHSFIIWYIHPWIKDPPVDQRGQRLELVSWQTKPGHLRGDND